MQKYTEAKNEQDKDKEPEAYNERQRLALEAQLPMEQLIAGVRDDVEAFAAQLGLTVIQRVMEAEIQKKLGPWGKQSIYRHGQQPGYVIYGGRKVSVARPRLRSHEAKEVPLASYKAFQNKGKMQQAVARQLLRQCSSRDYEGAIEGCLKGLWDQTLQCEGIGKPRRPRNWKS